jgi:hypothetical protein
MAQRDVAGAAGCGGETYADQIGAQRIEAVGLGIEPYHPGRHALGHPSLEGHQRGHRLVGPEGRGAWGGVRQRGGGEGGLRRGAAGPARGVAGRFAESGRPDDNPESFKVRLSAYNTQTAPLLPYYLGQKKLVEVDGMGTVDAVAAGIDNALDRPRG